MAWNVLPTWTSGQLITSSFLNNIAANFLETAAAKATQSGSYFAGTGVNGLAERIVTADTVAAAETTSSATAVDLATPGPAVAVTSGARVVLLLAATMSNSTVGAVSTMYTDATGAYTGGVSNQLALRCTSPIANALTQASFCYSVGTTAGLTTWTSKYAANTGTSTFQFRRLTILPF